jgi:hypothetical protein
MKGFLPVLVLVLGFCWVEDKCGSSKPAPKAQARSADSPKTSSTIQGFSANMFFAEQSAKNDAAMKALTEIRDRGKASGNTDVEASIRILRLRSVEVTQAINEVNTGAYSITDKEKMLKVLEMEQAWADASIIALASAFVL